MWVVEMRVTESTRWIAIAQCDEEQDADTVVAALQLAQPMNEFRKRKETGEDQS